MSSESSAESGLREWVVDNSDSGFSSVGDWRSSTRDPGFVGDDYLWHPTGKGEARAIWRTPVPQRGLYNVYARWVFSKSDDRAGNAPFTILVEQNIETVRVNMSEPQFAAEHPAGRVQSSWNLLGTYPFSDVAEVILHNDADNSVVADAVRFEYMAPVDWVPPGPGQLLLADDFNSMDNWMIEGSGTSSLENHRMRLLSDSDRVGLHAWYREPLPDNVRIEWDISFNGPKGFALVFFSVNAAETKDFLHDLPPREGRFVEYVNDPNVQGYHLSFHRMGTRAHVDGANLNKNPGKNLVQRRATDPCPPRENTQTYRAALIKNAGMIVLLINEKTVLFYHDRDNPYFGGYFGFRQLYGSDIEYSRFRVFRISE